MDTDQTQTQSARTVWRSIAAVLLLSPNHQGFIDVVRRIASAPHPHVILCRYAMQGVGCATPNLNPDGPPNDETTTSIENLYAAAYGYEQHAAEKEVARKVSQ